MKKESEPAGLFWSLVFRVTPLTVVVFLVIGYVVVTRTTESVSARVIEHHIEQHRHAEFEVKRKLDTLRESVRVLAANDLIINALIDVGSRDQYLPIFFRSLRIPGPKKAHIFLVDYKGRSVICNKGHTNPWAKELFWKSLERGREHFELTSERLLFAVPVLYHGLAEGAVIVEYESEQFAEIFTIEVGVDAVNLNGRDGSRIFLSRAAPEHSPTMAKQSANWFVHETALEEYRDIFIVTGVLKQKALHPVKSLKNFLVLAIGLNILALLASLFITGRIVRKPIAILVEGIQNTIQTGELTRQVDETGPRELRKIARSFNHLVSQLRMTMISRCHLDSMFYTMTAQLLPCINTGEIYRFITKPIIPEDLRQCIQDAIDFFLIHKDRIALVSELKEKNEKLRLVLEHQKQIEKQLQHLAVIDDLTGLYNRRYLSVSMLREFEQCIRYTTDLSCFMMDLDHFKQINDTYGHAFGDFVLREFSKRLKKVIRGSDLGFRYGGEEFFVLMPHTTMEKALVLGDRILRACRSVPFKNGGEPVTVTVSIGAVSFVQHQPQTHQEMIKLADKMLYKAKENGRDKIVYRELMIL